MSLVAFQTALGRSIRVSTAGVAFPGASDYLGSSDLSDDERTQLSALCASPGFEFTIAVQRSWCASRAASTARRTLSVLSAEQREALLSAWVQRGGGTTSFVAGEAVSFLEFIASRLPDPSHALTLCRLEQAVYRTGAYAERFARPDLTDLGNPGLVLRLGKHAALVPFFVEPEQLLAALQRMESPAALAKPLCHLLFAPGLPALCRRATRDEVELWRRLRTPLLVRALPDAHALRDVIGRLAEVGAIELIAD